MTIWFENMKWYERKHDLRLKEGIRRIRPLGFSCFRSGAADLKDRMFGMLAFFLRRWTIFGRTFKIPPTFTNGAPQAPLARRRVQAMYIYTHYIESSMSIILNKHYRNESCYGHEASRTSASILWISFGCALAHLDLHVMNSSMNQWMQQMQYIFESQGWTSVQSSDMLRSRTHPWSMNLPAKVVFKVWLFMHVAPAQWASVFDVSSCMVCCSYWVLECYSCYSVYLWIAWLL